ncbi:MAG: winged helix-turn-helix transcriptional regulator [Thermoplasmata archaeon]|nr:MAG: winged helix-turn-helix transcriptional regulator [Thermoplasmata archaeon]
MSGEWRLKLLGMAVLLLICVIFIIASGASAEEYEIQIDYRTKLLDEINGFQSEDGSWDNDINVSGELIVANYEALKRYPSDSVEYITYGGAAYRGTNWTLNNYHENLSVETHSMILWSTHVGTKYWDAPNMETDDFENDVYFYITDTQRPDGSWNLDVGDTSIATYALHKRGVENDEAVEEGLIWLQEHEDKDEFTWGSVEDDSKSILALDSGGIDVWKEISALALKQRPDGSFGGIEDTAWATMALTTHPIEEIADNAMTWLRSQKYNNINDLAIAALAEQFYENAKFEREGEGKVGSGFIPPPLMYTLSLLIIGSLVLSYWLFARLDRNGILDGVRKDIYIYIAENPGEHLAKITKKLDLSSGSARYHLSVLEGMDKIVSHKNGKSKRYYINKNRYSKYTNGNGYKHIMSALKNNTARKIVKFLISNPESNQKGVSNALKIYPSTVNWHVKRLKDAEIINKHRKGKEIVYSLNKDVQLKKVIEIIEGSIA